jgi:acyl carrier protein
MQLIIAWEEEFEDAEKIVTVQDTAHYIAKLGIGQ